MCLSDRISGMAGRVAFHCTMLLCLIAGYSSPYFLSFLLFDPLLTSPEVQAVAKAVPIAARQVPRPRDSCMVKSLCVLEAKGAMPHDLNHPDERQKCRGCACIYACLEPNRLHVSRCGSSRR